MDATPQLAMGASLAMRVRNPFVAFGIGLGSHVVLDAIPHYHIGWINGLSRLGLIDVAFGTCLALMIVAMAPAPWGSAFGLLGGVFPEVERFATGGRYDFLETPPFNFPHSVTGPPWGLITQLAATLIALGLAVWLRRRPSPRRGLEGEV